MESGGIDLATLTIENYVKVIYMICHTKDGLPASTGEIAESLGVSPGSVTSMIKKLNDTHLAQYTPYEGVRLTEAGRVLALTIVRRHRLIEVFLVNTLEMSWDEVHAEAENLEHAVSDLLVDRIDKFLEYPKVDPHGDPIPQPDGTVSDPASLRLDELPGGSAFRLLRVMDQTTDFLRFLSDHGLQPGTDGQIIEDSQNAGTLTVQVGEKRLTLSRENAAKLKVESISSGQEQPNSIQAL